eukprot:m.32523 g.32523  ORF g.32523 m.32523 type:complete len:214 (-) comp42415_c0_seq2:112-753(-)
MIRQIAPAFLIKRSFEGHKEGRRMCPSNIQHRGVDLTANASRIASQLHARKYPEQTRDLTNRLEISQAQQLGRQFNHLESVVIPAPKERQNQSSVALAFVGEESADLLKQLQVVHERGERRDCYPQRAVLRDTVAVPWRYKHAFSTDCQQRERRIKGPVLSLECLRQHSVEKTEGINAIDVHVNSTLKNQFAEEKKWQCAQQDTSGWKGRVSQ